MEPNTPQPIQQLASVQPPPLEQPPTQPPQTSPTEPPPTVSAPPPQQPVTKKASFFPIHSLATKVILGIILVFTLGGGGVFVLSQQSFSPAQVTPAPAPGCKYQEIACVKAPCPKVLICTPTPPPVPTGAPTLIPTFAPPTPTAIPITPTATPSAKSYTNSLNGYSLTYPVDFKVSSDSANLFEIQNPALIMTFTSETATDTAKASILKRTKFCPSAVVDTDATVSGKVAYKRDGTFLDGSNCLETVVVNTSKLLNIKGKPTAASASAGVTLFNQILSSLKFL